MEIRLKVYLRTYISCTLSLSYYSYPLFTFRNEFALAVEKSGKKMGIIPG